MVNVPGPFKMPPSKQPTPLSRAGGAEVPHKPHISARSNIPAFEVMRITGEIAAARAEGRDVVSLCAGEPDARPAPSNIKSAGYTSTLGTVELRRAIAGHYKNWYGIDVDPSQVAVTTGSSGAFQLGFLAAFDPGDRVALASPGYPAYRNILTALGVEVVELETGIDTRYQPTPKMLDKAVREGGSLAGLIVASPANPTGSMLSFDELHALSDWCKTHNTLLVSDEIYHGITFPQPGDEHPRGACAWQFGQHSIVINSFSKYWGMTGWRLGWALLPEKMVAPFEALASNFSLSPPAPAQQFALEAFTEETYAERDLVVAGFARARQLILDAEKDLNWGTAAPSDGAFYYYADLGPQLERFGDSMTYAKRLLDEADVALVPGVDFDPQNGKRAVRISYAAGEAAIKEALKRIIEFQAK